MAFETEFETQTEAKSTETETSQTQETQQTQTQETETQTQEQEFDAKSSYAEMQKQLGNVTRELGQYRGLQSKFDKLVQSQQAPKTNQNQTDFLGKYTPEQIAESEALIEHLWKKKFGQDWDGLQSFKAEASIDRAASTVEKTARNILGEDYEKLAPSMNAVGRELFEASQQGNQRAQKILDLMKTDPELGGEYFTSLAQQHYMNNVQDKSAQAVTAQVKRGERAAAGVAGGAQRGRQAKDPSKMSIEELRDAAELEARQS